MASSPSLTTIPLHEPVFQQFLHDVHHAYLLYFYIGLCHYFLRHMIPDIEPTPLPSTGVRNQPLDLLAGMLGRHQRFHRRCTRALPGP